MEQIRHKFTKCQIRPKIWKFVIKNRKTNQNSIFNVHDPVGIKYLTRLRLGLSHLNEHKFRHNFKDCLNPLCSCSLEVETVIHYFLHCHYYIICRTLLDTVNEIINKNLSDFSEQTLVNLLLYGNPSLTFEENKEIVKASIYNIHSLITKICWCFNVSFSF